MVSFLILLRSLRVYILKQLFFSISVNSGFRNIYLQARSRGRGWGGLEPPQKFSRFLPVCNGSLTMSSQQPPKKKSKQVENKQRTLLSWVKPCNSDTEPGVVEETIRIKEQPESNCLANFPRTTSQTSSLLRQSQHKRKIRDKNKRYCGQI